jgi:hypothetical protein
MWPWLGTGAAGMLEVFKTHIFKVKIVNPYKENLPIFTRRPAWCHLVPEPLSLQIS